jgi:MYXO-CTERM domain-containing protein
VSSLGRPAAESGCGCHLGERAGSPLAAFGLLGVFASLGWRRRSRKRTINASARRG